eukprot:jgi/Mesen1/5947/ME000301S05078
MSQTTSRRVVTGNLAALRGGYYSQMRWMRGCHGNGTQGPGRLCCPAWHPMDGCLLSPTARGHVPPGGAARGLLRTSRCQLEEAPLAPPRTSSRFTTPF